MYSTRRAVTKRSAIVVSKQFLTGKLHGVSVTRTELDYDGSIAIDISLLKAAGIKEYEHIFVYNVTNGERWETYAILAEEDSGIISVNGAGARKAEVGDNLIICVYENIPDNWVVMPKLVYATADNTICRIGNTIPTQTH